MNQGVGKGCGCLLVGVAVILCVVVGAMLPGIIRNANTPQSCKDAASSLIEAKKHNDNPVLQHSYEIDYLAYEKVCQSEGGRP